MHTLKRLFDFYIFSNIHVSVATFCLAKITLLSYGIKENLVPSFIFFATVLSYNFIRLYKLKEIQDWFFLFIRRHKKIIIGLSIVCLFMMLYLMYSLRYETILAMIPFGIFTLFYVIPLGLKKGSKKTLRSTSFLKLILIAFTWGGVTVLIPLINYDLPIGHNEVIVLGQRILFVAVITLPFDIRDLKYDDSRLKTVPQILGIQKTKVLGLLLLMLFLGLEFFKSASTVTQFRTHLFIAVMALLFLVKATENQHRYYSAFFVESLPILWLLFILQGIF